MRMKSKDFALALNALNRRANDQELLLLILLMNFSIVRSILAHAFLIRHIALFENMAYMNRM